MGYPANRPTDRGVTLLEMVVVLVLIAVLAAIVVPIFGGIERRRERRTCLVNLSAIGEALLMYRDDYRAFPPDVTEPWAVRDEEGAEQPAHALGLYYLNYLSERLDVEGGEPVASYATVEGNYLTDVGRLHCPANPAERADYSGVRAGADEAAYLGGYNAYDWYYRRDWDATLQALHADHPELPDGWAEMGKRHLKQWYPPDNTVVTWCTMHRNAPPTSALEGLTQGPGPRDFDPVLFADRTVEVLPASKEHYKARHP